MNYQGELITCGDVNAMLSSEELDSSRCLAARSRAGGCFFLGSTPRDNQNIRLNGNIHITCAILKLVAASTAGAELGALFLNAQEARILRLILLEIDHPQPRTPVYVDSITAVGIVKHTIKCQRSRAMEMRYFWLLDQKNNRYFKVYYQPGDESMGAYPNEAQKGHIHNRGRPFMMCRWLLLQ